MDRRRQPLSKEHRDKIAATLRRPVAERFWDRVNRGPGCWEWTAGLGSHGYGSLSVGGKLETTHRISWRLHFGPIPDGLHVLHHCDNKRCVRPDHLYLGSEADNSADRKARGRAGAARGEANPNHKLTTTAVAEIRRRLTAGETTRALGREFGVAASGISRIGSGQMWKEEV
jgi:HNH endonuclease